MVKKAKKPHYVDNKKFLQAMIDWRETWPDEDNIPPVTNYIGECFLKIATHLSYRPNIINYIYSNTLKHLMIRRLFALELYSVIL